MTELILYPKLSTRSQRAILRRKKKWGHPYHYNPRYDLLQRLAKEMGWPIYEVRNQLIREREYLLSRQNLSQV